MKNHRLLHYFPLRLALWLAAMLELWPRILRALLLHSPSLSYTSCGLEHEVPLGTKALMHNIKLLSILRGK